MCKCGVAERDRGREGAGANGRTSFLRPSPFAGLPPALLASSGGWDVMAVTEVGEQRN